MSNCAVAYVTIYNHVPIWYHFRIVKRCHAQSDSYIWMCIYAHIHQKHRLYQTKLNVPLQCSQV